MNASVPARFDREPQESAFGAGFRPLNLGIEWNAENQLKKVLKNAATIATFAYDPAGRRVEKVAGGTTTTFTYDAEDILREIAGATTTYYVHGPGIDAPLAKEISGSATYYHADALGSVLKTTNAAGSVTHEYRYDAYGKIEAGASQGGYAFTGREWDTESSLFYYRARYFDPAMGRFISEDPIGFIAGMNFYSYVGNMPVNFVDPFGFQSQEQMGYQDPHGYTINFGMISIYGVTPPPGGTYASVMMAFERHEQIHATQNFRGDWLTKDTWQLEQEAFNVMTNVLNELIQPRESGTISCPADELNLLKLYRDLAIQNSTEAGAKQYVTLNGMPEAHPIRSLLLMISRAFGGD